MASFSCLLRVHSYLLFLLTIFHRSSSGCGSLRYVPLHATRTSLISSPSDMGSATHECNKNLIFSHPYSTLHHSIRGRDEWNDRLREQSRMASRTTHLHTYHHLHDHQQDDDIPDHGFRDARQGWSFPLLCLCFFAEE